MDHYAQSLQIQMQLSMNQAPDLKTTLPHPLTLLPAESSHGRTNLFTPSKEFLYQSVTRVAKSASLVICCTKAMPLSLSSKNCKAHSRCETHVVAIAKLDEERKSIYPNQLRSHICQLVLHSMALRPKGCETPHSLKNFSLTTLPTQGLLAERLDEQKIES